MIKAMAKLADGGRLIVLGLSRGNVVRLKRDEPIVFNLAELGLPPKTFAISWKHADGLVAAPVDFLGFLLCLSGADLDRLQVGGRIEAEFEGNKYLVFAGESEQQMADMMKGFIKPRTKVTRKGFAPGQLPPVGD